MEPLLEELNRQQYKEEVDSATILQTSTSSAAGMLQLLANLLNLPLAAHSLPDTELINDTSEVLCTILQLVALLHITSSTLGAVEAAPHAVLLPAHHQSATRWYAHALSAYSGPGLHASPPVNVKQALPNMVVLLMLSHPMGAIPAQLLTGKDLLELTTS
ncbi:MAG: hypothetical protein FRX49_11477 [Trebouxia sp. A1-2]|nr:MAG: hypothetical protein FRX49_11477 [Trebouxia sp. A1-2]